MSQAAAQQVGNGRALSRARRDALSRGGKGNLPARPPAAAASRKPTAAAPTLVPGATNDMPAHSPTSSAPDADGSVVATAAAAEKPADCGCRHAAEAASAARITLTGRDAARQHRAERCANGRGDIPACRPTGRTRPRPERVAPKVEIGTTLSGRTITGTQVERTARVTGNEPGSCRVITGTEYIGAEQYGELCGIRPEARAPKVGISTTRRGQPVTGNELGRSPFVTGDEAGTCKVVTGTDYITNERFQSVCRARSQPPPAKLGITATRGGVKLTGTLVGRAAKVTGDEPGSCKRLTGTQYTEAEPAAACAAVPEKAPATHTQHGAAVTGTPVASAATVTGDEAGACKPVTGTDYAGLGQCDGAAAMPGSSAKSGSSRAWGGQRISGTQVGRSAKVTGDEQAACAAITGSSYVPREAYEQHCDAGAVAETRARTAARRTFAGQPLTGIQPGPDAKVTGITRRGACQPVSGTPYLGADQVPTACGGGSDAQTGVHHRIMAPVGESLPLAAAPTGEAIAPGAFSVISPAQDARLRAARRSITGTAYGAAGRITGPVALAAGLVTGTAEFRSRDHSVPAAASDNAVTATAAPARERITGEGRDVGIKVTGDDWGRSGRVTGTEGLWAKRRNPTWRGEVAAQGGQSAGARAALGRERPDVPVSRITGSSGNTGAGALVTLSGGARG